MSTTRLLSEIGKKDISEVGVNAALLGELSCNNFVISDGFVIPSRVAAKFIEGCGYIEQIHNAIAHYEAALKQTTFTPSEKTSESILTTNTFLHDILTSALSLNSKFLRVSLSLVAQQMDAHSALSVFNSYQVQVPDIFGAIQERVKTFRKLRTELEATNTNPYMNESIELALIVQRYQPAPSVISYTYDQEEKSVYMEYGDSLESIRMGNVEVKHIVMDQENLDLSSLLIPKKYQASLSKILHLHNQISELIGLPLEICWDLCEPLQITGIRVVKESVKEFAP
ncbi:MAG: hypothetical protein HY817_03585 [Candidatus Abawacabacteria bacterium]|nr:hypothetical protein [Candidatus Abawacabacteria bacterium]